MLDTILNDMEERMKKAIDAQKREYSTLRAGRANPSLLEQIKVDYYGVPTPINQLANVSAPEPRLLVIQPWDRSVIAAIEKAILKSDLGLTPTNDGNVIRIAIPQLTQERRNELVKLVKKKAEEFRVIIRNLRREANDEIKKLEKEGAITEDESRKGMDQVQKLTDKYIEQVDKILANKEAEILEI